jgi:hypothetical protein
MENKMEIKKKVYLGTFVLATTILLSSCSSTNNFKDKQQVKEDPYNITLKESRTNVKINIISTTSKIADKRRDITNTQMSQRITIWLECL